MQGVLGHLSVQLTPRFFKDGDGRFPIGFGPEDGHPLGRLLQVWRPDDEIVRYRIDGKGRIRVEERVGGGHRVVTLVDEYVRATPGRVLPGRVETTSWDLRTGARLCREEVVTSFGCVEHVWLPPPSPGRDRGRRESPVRAARAETSPNAVAVEPAGSPRGLTARHPRSGARV